MVTDIELDSELMEQWFEEIIETYGETDFTSQLINQYERNNSADPILSLISFLPLIHEWFQEYGLLLMDAADPAVTENRVKFL